MRSLLIQFSFVVGLLLCGSCGPKPHGGDRQQTEKGRDASEGKGEQQGELAFRTRYLWDKLLTWESGPFVGTKQGSNLLRLALHDNEGREVPITDLKFWPYMSVHGHGAEGKVRLTRVGQHAFLIDGFVFTMAGPWELEIRLEAEGQKYALSIPLTL